MNIKLNCVAIALLSSLPCNAAVESKDNKHVSVMLAELYESDVDVNKYWKSEKLDGIRAIWDGNTLRTRSGRKLYAPFWFIDALPDEMLEGELWAGRGNFNLVQNTVLDTIPTEAAWQKVRFMLFDAPRVTGDYIARYKYIVNLVDSIQADHVDFVEHTPISSEQDLTRYFDQINDANGEGVMLRQFKGEYKSGRGDQLLKMKRHNDDEAIIVGYRTGKGKLEGMVGALLVQLDSGLQFYIGSGLSDQLRASPPKLGSRITFRHNGYTHKGIPKFARFLRVRVDYVTD
ncbi:ATP-dependent DNA ligase [Vibrio zhanjiangensis]|uniref:ATP-dependent DNA ligase n=1 Tax=Vibrio zhanjiangensis TaxID=1046128 RepID=A0ABQ6F320_9VIBR|nr:DNA ligase [Vibrio zhanjiangensis]GLT19912.1 ATP-dependent DNA ligase [Vibrio zhanjiangensis]